jgi:hypothetical protein
LDEAFAVRTHHTVTEVLARTPGHCQWLPRKPRKSRGSKQAAVGLVKGNPENCTGIPSPPFRGLSEGSRQMFAVAASEI